MITARPVVFLENVNTSNIDELNMNPPEEDDIITMDNLEEAIDNMKELTWKEKMGE